MIRACLFISPGDVHEQFRVSEQSHTGQAGGALTAVFLESLQEASVGESVPPRAIALAPAIKKCYWGWIRSDDEIQVAIRFSRFRH